MRVIPLLALVSTLCLAGSTARADVAPDPDPYMACEQLALGSACFSELGRGHCVEADCPDDPGQKCGYCDPKATATTGADTAGTTEASTGANSTGGASGSSSETAVEHAGETSDGSTTKKDDGRGCGCRSDTSPGAALALLGLVGLARRRRR